MRFGLGLTLGNFLVSIFGPVVSMRYMSFIFSSNSWSLSSDIHHLVTFAFLHSFFDLGPPIEAVALVEVELWPVGLYLGDHGFDASG